MSNKINNFLNALIEVCEAYCEAKEKADAKKAEMDLIQEVFGETANNRAEVISVMIDKGWKSYEIDRVLPEIDTPEKAKIAVHMIKSGKYRYYDISRTLSNL